MRYLLALALGALVVLSGLLFLLDTWPQTSLLCYQQPSPTPSPSLFPSPSALPLPRMEDYWVYLDDIMNQGEAAEGYILIEEANYYHGLASEPFVNTVCEIGFNAGHSTSVWLSAGERKLKVYSFDMFTHHYSIRAKRFIELAFPNRFTLTTGDSTQTVPAFTSNTTNKHIVCDIIHVDGGHFGEIPLLDLRNMRPLAGTNTIVLIDDVSCPQYWCADPQKAWDQMKAEGEIEECQCFSINEGRGWCVGHYLRPGHKTHETSNVCSIIAERHSKH